MIEEGLTERSTTGVSEPQAIYQRCLEIVLVFMVFMIIGGELVPHNNEAHYLSRLKHYWNPTWCQGDLFLASQEAHLVFVLVFGWVTKWLSLTATAWLGRILCWGLLAWAWQRLSWRITATPFAAVLSAALFVSFIYLMHLAGEWVVGGVEAKGFAYFFVLLALAALVDGKWNQTWCWLGAATAFHAIVGGWSGVICLGIWFWDGRRETRFIAMLPGLAVAAVLGLVGVIPALVLTSGETPDTVAEANRIYVFERLPHHLALLRLPTDEISLRVVRHAGLLLGLFVLGYTEKSIDSANASRMRTLRLFAWGAVSLAVCGFVIELALWNDPLRAAAILKYYWFRLTDFAAAMAAALQLTSLACTGIKRGKGWGLALLLVGLAISGWQLADVAKKRFEVGRPPAEKKLRNYEDWLDVCKWIEQNTPSEALFLTPRLAHSFKWHTGRPELVTRKDIPQSASDVVEWFQRMRDVHYYQKDDEWRAFKSLGHAGTSHIEQLSEKHPFDYVLTDNRRRLGFPIVYRNDTYVLYDVRRD